MAPTAADDRTLRRVRSTFIAALALAAVAGCGSASSPRLTHDEYLAQLHEIEVSPAVRDASRQFFELASGAPRTSCATEARSFADAVGRLVDRVARIRPPRGDQALQDRFVAPARRTVALLDRLARDVAAGRVACGMAWNRRAYGLPSTAEAERVLAEYAKRGYLLSWNSGD